jgi:pilus assembly protein Flp/PilA
VIAMGRESAQDTAPLHTSATPGSSDGFRRYVSERIPALYHHPAGIEAKARDGALDNRWRAGSDRGGPDLRVRPIAVYGAKPLKTLARFRLYTGRQAPRSAAMFRVLIELFNNEDGATAIEYALIAVLISIAAVAIMQNVGSNLTSIFTTVASDL